MVIYLVSNNLVLNDIQYETEASIDEKRKNRPLSIEGEKLANELSQKLKVKDIYASSFASALASAKYVSKENQTIISINSNLDDVKIGVMSKHNISMLRFMQDKNFDYKYPNGESLNEAKRRMKKVFEDILSLNSDAIIFTHKRAIMALLLNYCEVGYNLNDRLILSFNDKVVVDDAENDIDILKLTFEENELINIEVGEI